jgi:hypothetical protein
MISRIANPACCYGPERRLVRLRCQIPLRGQGDRGKRSTMDFRNSLEHDSR